MQVCFHTLFLTVLIYLFGTLAAVAEGLVVPLVPLDAGKKAIVPNFDIQGWNSDVNLVDTSWVDCDGAPGGIGFDSAGDYAPYISLDMSPYMPGNNTTCYVRAKFTLSEAVRQELDYLALRIRYDDGFVAYLNGQLVTSANAPLNLGRRAAASQPHEAQSLLTFDISQFVNLLVAGENIFALHGMNVSGSSPDFLVQFELLARKNYRDNFVSDLPIVLIDTDNNQPISQSAPRNADMGVINNRAGNEHRVTDASNDFSGRIQVQQEWNEFGYAKNHYLLTIVDNQGIADNASLLGMPEGDEWILYAPFNDKTLLRTVLMGSLAADMGHGAAPRLCHLFVNDDYLGIYVLLAKPNRHANRIDISELLPATAEGDALTGGYILELNNKRWLPGFDSPVLPFRDALSAIRYLYSYPAANTITAVQQQYMQNFMNGFEADVVNKIDINSAADYFILSEFSKNIDAYRNNTILYKDRDSISPKLFLASPWDFNSACGNTRQYDGDNSEGWQLSYLTAPNEVREDSMLVPLWWQTLAEENAFKKAVFNRWNFLSAGILAETTIADKLDSLYDVLDNDRVLNFERWPITGIPIEPNGYVGSTYDADFDHFYVWMIDRIIWLSDAMLEFETAVAAEKDGITDFRLEQNYPNPFNPTTTISYTLPAKNTVQLKIYDVRGVLVDQIVSREQAAGSYSVQWDGSRYASGLYLCKLTAGNFSQTIRMLMIR